jgi:hypothetical protein
VRIQFNGLAYEIIKGYSNEIHCCVGQVKVGLNPNNSAMSDISIDMGILNRPMNAKLLPVT